MIEVELPDGSIAEFPDGMAQQDIEKVLRKQQGYLGKPLPQEPKKTLPQKLGDSSTSFLDNLGNPKYYEGALRALGQGTSFGFGDELIAKTASTIASPILNYMNKDIANQVNFDQKDLEGQVLEDERTKMSEFRKDAPVTSILSEIAGSLGTGKGVLNAADKIGDVLNVAQKPTQFLARFAEARPVTATAATGGVSANLYATGTGEGDVKERLKGAVLPTVMGTAFGGGAGLVVNKLSKVADNMILKKAQKIDQRLAEEAGEEYIQTDKPIKKIVDRLRKDFPDEVEFQSALNKYLNDADLSLSEIGKTQTTNLAKGAAQFPSGEKGAEYLIEKTAGSSQRIKENLSKYISKDTDFYGTLDDVVAKGQKKAKPLYEIAYSSNKTVESREIDRILDTPAGRKALKDTARIMQNDRSLLGVPDAELKSIQRDLTAIGKMEEVKGSIARGLNLRTLDAVKKNLDDEIGKLYRSGDSYEAGVLVNLKNSLLKELDQVDETGMYALARATSGDYLTIKNAMENGRDFMRYDPEIIAKNYKKLNDVEKEAFKAGVVRKLRDTIDKAPDSADMSKRIFGRTEIRNKLKSVLSEADFENLSSAMESERYLFSLKNSILGNSNTASKQIAAAEFDEAGEQLLQQIAVNPKRGVIEAVATPVVDFIKRRASGLSDANAGRVAELLYETDPVKKQAIVKKIQMSIGNKPAESKLALKTYFELQDSVDFYRQALKPASTGTATGIISGEPVITVTPKDKEK